MHLVRMRELFTKTLLKLIPELTNVGFNQWENIPNREYKDIQCNNAVQPKAFVLSSRFNKKELKPEVFV